MDGVSAAIKNATDVAVVAAESMPDLSVRSASDVHKILNFVNVEISMYGDSDTENVKITLPHHLSVGRNLKFLKSMKYFSLLNVQMKLNRKCSPRTKILLKQPCSQK